MTQPENHQAYPVEEAIRAQNALRDLAGLPPEMFPIQAFVGMISDEVETLRNQGRTDEEIAEVIRAHSKIDITPSEIVEHYASPAERYRQDG